MSLFQLKRAFGEMNEGTKIISTKEFCPVDFKINDRNAGNDIGSIMRVSEMKSVADGFRLGFIQHANFLLERTIFIYDFLLTCISNLAVHKTLQIRNSEIRNNVVYFTL